MINYARSGHTFGAYFRLFARDDLPSDIGRVVYFDLDIVVLKNLDDLWSRVATEFDSSGGDGDHEKFFLIGKSNYSGSIALNLRELPRFWPKLTAGYAALTPAEIGEMDEVKVSGRHAEEAEEELGVSRDRIKAPQSILDYIDRMSDGLADQKVLLAFKDMFPGNVGKIEKPWDIHMANGAWRYAKRLVNGEENRVRMSLSPFTDAPPYTLTEQPSAGMLCFNGAGSSPGPYHEDTLKSNPKLFREFKGWNAALYYAGLPWMWLEAQGRATCVYQR